MNGEQNAPADGSAHGCRRGRSPIRASVRLRRPAAGRPAAPSSGYLSDSSLHNSASLSLALTSLCHSQERDSHILFTAQQQQQQLRGSKRDCAAFSAVVD